MKSNKHHYKHSCQVRVIYKYRTRHADTYTVINYVFYDVDTLG